MQCVTDSLVRMQKVKDIEEIWSRIRTKLHPLIENQIRHNSSLCKMISANHEQSSLTSRSNNTTRIIFG